jgi:tRNA 5-methylaminomethyl-2-thiouridine biosynthesis bifunctional protein
MTEPLSPGRILWRDGRTPVSERFGDVYFSPDDGLAEARTVFLDGIGLPAAWRGRTVFTIGETGFGTGLNFLATWDRWRRDPERSRRLNYVSVDGFPLERADMARALAGWPELAPLADRLIAALPHRHPGFHRLILDDGAVTLTLLYGEASAMLAALEALVDAWYLDGFAPRRNPEMWTDRLFAEIARLSRHDARVATFTAAGLVRRGLEAAGFRTGKAPGFGHKRERLRAVYAGPPAPARVAPWVRLPEPRPEPGRVVIVGAGIAGSSLAAALRRRGWQVRVAERHPAPASEASGNPIVMPRLIAGTTPDRFFHAVAWQFTRRELDRLGGTDFQACGVLQLPVGTRDRDRQIAALRAGVLPEACCRPVEAPEAAALAGVPVTGAGLWFPDAGCIVPASLCRALLDGVELDTGTEVRTLDLDADLVILANSADMRGFPATDWLPLTPRRGQISRIAATSRSAGLRCVLEYGGYATPPIQGEHIIGATFDPIADAVPAPAQSPTAEDDARNLAQLRECVPELFGADIPAVTGSRAAVRAMSPDHLPMVGPALRRENFLSDFALLRHGNTRHAYPEPPCHPGLFMAAGFGARGLVTAPFAAELLASQIAGDPWPVERDVAAALHPARFLVRALKQGAL